MDVTLLIIVLLQITFALIMSIFLLKIYNETRYLPTFFLGLFFMVTSVQFITFLTIFIPIDGNIARIFIDISNYLILIVFLIFILAMI